MSWIGSRRLLGPAIAVAAACGGGAADKAGGAAEPASEEGEKWEGPAPTTDDEEEPDDGLVVKGLHGRLEPHQIDAGLSPHQAALSRCYNVELKQKRFLGGKLSLKILVGLDGQVSTAQIIESNLGSWTVEKCLLEIAREMMFAPPRGGDGRADFTVPLDFTSGRPNIDFWEEERIAEPVAEKRPELDACAEKASVPAPSNVTVTLYVGNRGEVKSVGFASPAKKPIEDEWAGCAAEVIAAWVMPDPLGVIAKTSFRYRPK